MARKPIELTPAEAERLATRGRLTFTRDVTKQTSQCGSSGTRFDDVDFTKEVFVDPGGTIFFGPGPYLKVPHRDGETRHRIYPRWLVGDTAKTLPPPHWEPTRVRVKRVKVRQVRGRWRWTFSIEQRGS